MELLSHNSKYAFIHRWTYPCLVHVYRPCSFENIIYLLWRPGVYNGLVLISQVTVVTGGFVEGVALYH